MKYPKLKPEQDARYKILPSQYQEIKKSYRKLKSYRAVARLYNVNKGTIKAIIHPNWYLQKQQKRYAKKPWLEQYQKTKSEWCKIMQKHRAKKRKLQPDEIRKYRHSKRGKIFNKKKCIICGEEFMPTNTKQMTCPRSKKYNCYYQYKIKPKKYAKSQNDIIKK